MYLSEPTKKKLKFTIKREHQLNTAKSSIGLLTNFSQIVEPQIIQNDLEIIAHHKYDLEITNYIYISDVLGITMKRLNLRKFCVHSHNILAIFLHILGVC